MKDLQAKAEPTREFFVTMLTRDISLEDCIFDLIDNCLDGARRELGSQSVDDPADKAFKHFKCTIEFSGTSFVIADNCGGIPLDIARHYAFRFGRDPDAPIDKFGVGIYGIGMKRAIFKIGRKADVHSITSETAFRVELDVNEWLSTPQPRWSFPITMESKSGKKGTRIEITKLNTTIGSEFDDEGFERGLLRTIGRDYSLFLERGFAIKVNGSLAAPERFDMRSGEGFSPARIAYKDESGVRVEIFAGMASIPADEDSEIRSDRDTALSGWYVFCNDRTIIAADKSERTVWGYASIPDWHVQYNGFKGLVFFRSADPSLLPWTTTKRDIDLRSPVYRRALSKMREPTRAWTAYTNQRKGDVEKAKGAEKRTNAVSLLDLPKRASMALPKLRGPARTSITISYQQSRAKVGEVRRALGDEALTNREVGERTFDYYYDREVDD
ncbi:MAG: ATP-binding protein [Micropepsaceae bacterium]